MEIKGDDGRPTGKYASMKMVSRKGRTEDSAILEEISVLAVVQQHRLAREGRPGGDPRAFHFPMVYEFMMVGSRV